MRRSSAWEEESPIETTFSWCPLRFRCQNVEDAYVARLRPINSWWTIWGCVLYVFVAILRSIVMMLQPCNSRSEVILTIVTYFGLFFTMLAALLVKHRHEKLAACIGCMIIAIQPLLDHRRVTWLVGEVVETQHKAEVHPAADDTIFVLHMLLTAVLFCLLMPVRARFSWIVPAVVPFLYAAFTVPLVCNGSTTDITNSLVTVVILGMLCMVILMAVIRIEMSLRNQFGKLYTLEHDIMEKCKLSEAPSRKQESESCSVSTQTGHVSISHPLEKKTKRRSSTDNSLCFSNSDGSRPSASVNSGSPEKSFSSGETSSSSDPEKKCRPGPEKSPTFQGLDDLVQHFDECSALYREL